MLFKDMPIRRKLMRIIFLISGIVLLVTCITFFIYEFYAFRKTTVEKLSTIGKIISANSTAALAFDNQDDAKEILAALKTEPHIVAAGLYDKNGYLFSRYSSGTGINVVPPKPGLEGYHFIHSHLEGFQPVMLESRQLGTLYLKSDLGAMYERLRLYGLIVALVVSLSFLLAYLLSKILQKSISTPVLALAETAKVISNEKDYSVRAVKTGNDEVGALTDAFNNMLEQIQDQTRALQEQQRQEQVKMITTTLDAQEKERNLIGQELHDNVNQILVGTKLFLSMIKQDPVKNKLLINSCMETIQQAIDENRKIAHALVAPDFETKILTEQIADLTDNMLKTSGIDVDINTSYLVESQLEEDQKLAIYRIAQEQCANIIKYAKAQLVDISLSTYDECFKMIIADDGIGMEANKPTKGIGLKNIKGRLSIFNGTVTIKSAPGKGFALEITMPLKKANISDLRSPKTKNIVSTKKDTL
jgi:signal transduction histidine kinase